MSLFLAIAAALVNRSVKSFHYAPGLGECIEDCICLLLMIVDHEQWILWACVFVGVIAFTMLQRLGHLRGRFAEDEGLSLACGNVASP